ncbi:MAG: hypothetical protein VB124_05750 [Burkholderia sp.]
MRHALVLAHVLARKDRESTHEPESLTEASLGLWRVNVTSASPIYATTPRPAQVLGDYAELRLRR